MMEKESASESYHVPPGFRFHPTEEELVGYYLARKVAATQSHKKIDLDGVIQELDLYSIEPWDLQARCRSWQQQQAMAVEHEWYFFSYKDRKYPSGTRTNRATAAGFWKATGRDKPVLSSRSPSAVIGMRKTLVFYRGRAPNGCKTDWIIHEYRLVTDHHHRHQEQQECWVVCRAFQKPTTSTTLHQLQLQRPPSSCSFFPATSYGSPPHSLTHHHHHHHLQQQHAGGYNDQYDGGLLASSRPLPPAPVAGGLLCSSLDLEEECKMILSNIRPTAGTGGNHVPAAADHRNHSELVAMTMQQQGPIDWNFLDALLHDSAVASTLLH